MSRSSRSTDEFISLGFDLRMFRKTAITAGIVVAAPMAISVVPTARRRWAGNRSEMSRPIPTPSAVRVLTMKPNVGRLRTTLFIENSPWTYAPIDEAVDQDIGCSWTFHQPPDDSSVFLRKGLCACRLFFGCGFALSQFKRSRL